MGKKQPNTPRSRVKAAIHRLWLYSRERAKALKDHDRKCVDCGIKQSAAKGKVVKLEVHHEDGIKWKEIIDLIFKYVLSVPQVPLCKNCHKERHMEKYIKVYLDAMGYTVADLGLIPCEIKAEGCTGITGPPHHIDPRGMGGNPDKDVIENLIGACTPCHIKAEASIISKDDLREIVARRMI